MHHAHLPGEAAEEAAHSLRGEGNLGHQYHRLATKTQRLGHRLHVDLSLARTGHPMQQIRTDKFARGSLLQTFLDDQPGCLLVNHQRRRLDRDETQAQPAGRARFQPPPAVPTPAFPTL